MTHKNAEMDKPQEGRLIFPIAEDIQSVRKIRAYLCDDALTHGVSACERCECVCGYGKRYIKLGTLTDRECMPKFKSWLTEQELSKNTIDAYMLGVRMFFEKHDEISKGNGIEFKRELIASGAKPRTVNNRLCAFNAYCRMLDRPKEQVKQMKIQNVSSIENVIREEQYHQMLAQLQESEDQRWYFNLRLLASTGARVSEYIRLTKADFDRGYAEMWTKGKVRRIYIPKSFRDEAASYYAEFAPTDTLAKGKDGKPISTRGVAQALVAIGTRCGIGKELLHPHGFRHMFALNFLRETGNNLSLLSDVLGHSSVATTAIYTRMSKEQQRSTVDQAVTW